MNRLTFTHIYYVHLLIELCFSKITESQDPGVGISVTSQNQLISQVMPRNLTELLMTWTQFVNILVRMTGTVEAKKKTNWATEIHNYINMSWWKAFKVFIFFFCYETMSICSQNCWIDWNSAMLCFKQLFHTGVWMFARIVRPLLATILCI